jgi:hypothetical protein
LIKSPCERPCEILTVASVGLGSAAVGDVIKLLKPFGFELVIELASGGATSSA